MKPEHYNRLQSLRRENDAHKFMMDDMRPRFDRMAGRHENGTAPRAIAVHQLFQTPPALALRMARALDLKPQSRILEPSAGLGRILDALEPYRPAEVVAVELAAECARALFEQNRPGVTIKQRDFLTLTPADLGTFDAVAMNPPFTMRSDVRHILHALTFLRPGGRLVAICLAGYQRRETFDTFGEWIDLDAGTFKEAGTNVPTAMIIVKK